MGDLRSRAARKPYLGPVPFLCFNLIRGTGIEKQKGTAIPAWKHGGTIPNARIERQVERSLPHIRASNTVAQLAGSRLCIRRSRGQWRTRQFDADGVVC